MQPLKASNPIVVTVFGISTLVKDVQPSNPESSIVTTESGTVNVVPAYLLNEYLVIVSMLDPTSNVISASVVAKASCPIEVTLVGITISSALANAGV